MSQQDNGKLIATAVGAAAAGASLAVLAMKMIESNTKKSPPPQHYPASSRSRYLDPYDPIERRDLPNVIMNDPSMLMTDPTEQRSASIIGPPSLNRNDSEPTLFPHNHEEKMRRRIATRYTIEEENNLPRNSVTVRVPATSANVGPGCKSKNKTNDD
jgi:homoserine kinase